MTLILRKNNVLFVFITLWKITNTY